MHCYVKNVTSAVTSRTLCDQRPKLHQELTAGWEWIGLLRCTAAAAGLAARHAASFLSRFFILLASATRLHDDDDKTVVKLMPMHNLIVLSIFLPRYATHKHIVCHEAQSR